MANAFPYLKTNVNSRLLGLASATGASSVQAIAPARADWIDVFRGMAIVAVAVIHTSSSCQRIRKAPDTAWFVFAELSRLLQFAVPAFLMLSALVLTRSLLRDASPMRYARNRVQTLLWPALLWSALCVPYVHWLQTGIAWRKAFWLVWSGEADFHLYFLRVLLQLCLILPIFMPILRTKPAFWKVCFATTTLTLGALLSNRFYFHVTNPASWIFWYIPPVTLGMWLGTQSERWAEISRKAWPFALTLTFLSGLVYVPFALQSMEGHDVRAILYPLSWWVYSSSAAFLLFCSVFEVCRPEHQWAQTLRPLKPVLSELGRNSLQIYLLHPIVLALLQKQMELLESKSYATPGDLMLLFASRLSLCLLWPLLFAWSAERLRLSRLLFGR